MWTVENRSRYNRDHLRYPSGLTDEEWALIEPLIPPGKRGGGSAVDLREVATSDGEQAVRLRRRTVEGANALQRAGDGGLSFSSRRLPRRCGRPRYAGRWFRMVRR